MLEARQVITASVDIETLSTRANAVVVSLGVCFFDDEKENSFEEIVASGEEWFFCRAAQEEKGRRIDGATLEWWAKQGDAARRCLEPAVTINPRDFHGALEALCGRLSLSYSWIMKHCRWFSRGNAFDIAIMESLFGDFNVSTPWKYYNVRDIRTWLECNGLPDNLKLVKPQGMIAHNALHDAAFDAWMMQQVLHRPKEELQVAAK